MARRAAIFACLLIALAFVAAPAAAQRMGRIVDITGDADIVSLNTGGKLSPAVGTVIMRDYRVRTGAKSTMEIQLDDGTKVIMRETTVLSVLAVKTREQDPPARIRLLGGTARVISASRFRSRALVVKAPTAIVGIMGGRATDVGMVASAIDARVVVFKGEIDAASSVERIIKSYAVGKGEEVRIAKNSQPEPPRKVPEKVFNAWFETYYIDENDAIVRIDPNADRSILDSLLRKKRY
ncbi:MAG TPA: FecR family protein [Spirochaetota bacterium]|nr:FecR family protein [Spirochaetota bacterium]